MALWEVLFTGRSLVQNAESAEIMITAAVGGLSAGFTSHESLSHVQRVMAQLGHGDESKSDVMWLAADVSRIGQHGRPAPLQR
jgi:hypothetical protein